MKEENKQSKILKRKPMNRQTSRNVKFTYRNNDQCTDLPSNTKLKYHDSELKSETISPLLIHPNISLIQSSSFMSNKHDGSFDSMDKMIIIGAGGLDNKDEQQENDINTSTLDIDYTHLHEQYQEVIGKKELLEDQIQGGDSEDDEYEDEIEEEEKENEDNEEQRKQIKHYLSKHKKYEEYKKDQSYNSIKFLAANLSEIHEQREINYNNRVETKSKENQDEEEKDLIDLMNKPQKKNSQKTDSFHRRPEEEENADDDQMVTLLQKQLEQKQKKQTNKVKKIKNKHYPQILEELEESQVGVSSVLEVLKKRERWIEACEKQESWKQKQRNFLNKMKNILNNPFYQS